MVARMRFKILNIKQIDANVLHVQCLMIMNITISKVIFVNAFSLCVTIKCKPTNGNVFKDIELNLPIEYLLKVREITEDNPIFKVPAIYFRIFISNPAYYQCSSLLDFGDERF